MPIDTAWIEQVQADSLSRLEAVERMQQQLQGLTGSARSADGYLQVEVTPSGALIDLRIDSRALEGGGERIAAEILSLAAQATTQVAAEVKEIVSGVIPEGDLDSLLAGQVPESSRQEVEAELAARRGGPEVAVAPTEPPVDPPADAGPPPSDAGPTRPAGPATPGSPTPPTGPAGNAITSATGEVRG